MQDIYDKQFPHNRVAAYNFDRNVSGYLLWLTLGRRHVKFTLSGKTKTLINASMLLASFNTLPFDNLNPELGNAGMAGIDI